jgi:hypothetical protein
MLGAAEHLASRSAFDDLSLMHDGYEIRNLANQGQVVRNEEVS